MTQRNIDVMDIIVDKIASGDKLSSALKFAYNKRNVCVPYNDSYADVAIVDLHMSMRTTNALLRGGLHTVGAVVKFCDSNKITSLLSLGNMSGIEVFETILDYCWEHMDQNAKTQFLIDTVERNSDNIREEVA